MPVMYTMNLTERVESQAISKITVYRRFHQGKLPVPSRKGGGLILVDSPIATTEGQTAVYARVSPLDQGVDLDRQVARISRWATENGISIDKIVTEVGSALNGHRRKFLALVNDPSVARIIVEHRGRFAVEYVEAAQGRELVVVDPAELDDDLVRDMTEILASFCARLHGKRAATNRTRKVIELACAPLEPGP